MREFFDFINGFKDLCNLYLEKCFSLESFLEMIGDLFKLEVFRFCGCMKLKYLLEVLGFLINLWSLYLIDCINLVLILEFIGNC